ncbi:MAG: penicillin-binding protein 2 [Halanaerobiales bacterium]
MDNRVSILRIVVVIILILLVLRAGQLQLLMGNYYYELSEGNRLSERPISAPRGRIIDRNNNILVSNKESYNLYLLPNEVSPEYEVEDLLMKLSDITGIDLELLNNNYEMGKSDSSSAVLLRRNISREMLVIVKENDDNLPGILIEDSSMREYVYGEFAPHLIGYVGEISLEELRRFSVEGYNYRGGDVVGKTGLEAEYEFYLRGHSGIEQVEVNSQGKIVKTLSIKSPVTGNDIILNLDLELQQYVERILEDELYRLREIAENDDELFPPTGAAVIVMDPNTGAILAMVSKPGYDLNDFARGLSYEKFDQLNNDPLRPLYNRPIMSQVNPGSIFKLVTGTAAIENLGVNADTVFVDETGKYTIGEWEYRNWHQGGEGKLSFTRAIARSNNVVFYKLGHQLYNEYRGDRLAWTARQYGLGSKTGVDLPTEKEGLVPDNDWKWRTQGEIWYPGDAVHLSIGQKITTTPLQLINMVSAIANGGNLYQPYIVDKIVNADNEIVVDFKPELSRKLPFEEETYEILRQGLIEVTNASYGTASSRFRDFPVKVAGKTGTAQTSAAGANHGWFAGFAPANDPEIAVLVFLEEGNSSAYTLPIAKEIFREYFGIEEPVEDDQTEEGSEDGSANG